MSVAASATSNAGADRRRRREDTEPTRPHRGRVVHFRRGTLVARAPPQEHATAMDFALSPQHEEIRRTVREFADRRISPVADELERKGEFPHDVIREAADLGLLGVPYPEEIGGTGLDALAYAITVEELSRVS